MQGMAGQPWPFSMSAGQYLPWDGLDETRHSFKAYIQPRAIAAKRTSQRAGWTRSTWPLTNMHVQKTTPYPSYPTKQFEYEEGRIRPKGQHNRFNHSNCEYVRCCSLQLLFWCFPKMNNVSICEWIPYHVTVHFTDAYFSGNDIDK